MKHDVKAVVERLRELLAKATTPNPFDWYFPWRVVPFDGKPIIAGARSGNLFRGYIATWDEAELIVETLNALPALLDALSSQSPPQDGRAGDVVERIIASEPDRGYSDGVFVFTHGQAERMVRKALAAISALRSGRG